MTTPHPSFPATPLRRSRTDRRIAGVCGGLAASFGIDVTLVRVLVVLLAVVGNLVGLVLYLACWALVPEADVPQADVPPVDVPRADVPGEAEGPAAA